MTISNTNNRVSYDGTGSTTAFPVAFPFHAQSDLVVIETVIATGAQTTKTITTDYTISGTTDAQGHYPSGGTVNAVTAPPATVRWTIYRDVPATQSVDLVEGDPLPVDSSVESPLDRLTMIVQRIKELVTRSLRQPEGDSVDIAAIPPKVTRASQYLGFDAAGDPVALAAPANTTAVTAFMATVLDDADAATARATLGASALSDVNPLIKGINDFRLTLTSGTPVTTADVTAAGTLYCTPYKGDQIALYSGSVWNLRTSAEFSLSLTLTSGKPYDIFCYDSGGTPTLEILVWTDDTNRATALAYQDGVLVKSGDATRRYLGTLYASGTDQTEDSKEKRYLWNYYNRVTKVLKSVDLTGNWAYTVDTWRKANNSATSAQFNFVLGLSEEPVEATVTANARNTTGGVKAAVGIGLDSSTADSSQHRSPGYLSNASGTHRHPMVARYKGYPTIGKHFLAWLERSEATGTTTWQSFSDAYTQGGLLGEFRC